MTWLAETVGISVMLTLPVSAGQQEPVWMFDHKDTFLDIACINEQEAVVVGDRGRVLVTHGAYENLWSPRESNTREMLTSLSFIDEERGWAAGHGGIILHTQDGGDNWQVQRKSSPENLPLFDIQFVSKDIGYASGAYDTFLKTVDGGQSWTSLPTGSDNIYNGVFFHDADNGFLVGEFGSLLKTSDGGESWQQTNVEGYQGSLFGIVFLTPRKALAHGINGKLAVSHDGGENWTDVPTGTTEALYRAAVLGDEVVVVGKSGIVLESSDGAESFTARSATDNNSLAGVCAGEGGRFLAVGEFGTIMGIELQRNE